MPSGARQTSRRQTVTAPRSRSHACTAARFRANYFVQQSGAACVFRIIPEEIISLEDLNLPQAVRDLAEWILEDKLPVRMQLQLHKILWNDEPGH